MSAYNYLAAAGQVHSMCARLGLTILSLQPFRNFEGTIDAAARSAAIEEFALWLDIVARLGTDTIGVPSTIVPDGHTGDFDTLVQDLGQIATMAAMRTPPVRIAYENLSFGAYVRTWQQAYALIQEVGMPNLGFLPDTFNIAGSAWADPAASRGKIPKADKVLERSMDEYCRTVDPKNIFLIQVADGEALDTPLVAGHPFYVAGQPARMSWSRNARLFPFEKKGYLPVVKVLKAITAHMAVGPDRWVSMEVFSRTTGSPNPECVRQHAERGWRSWMKLARTMGWTQKGNIC